MNDRSKSWKMTKSFKEVKQAHNANEISLRPVSPHIISTPDLTPKSQEKVITRTRNPNATKSKEKR